MKVTTWNINGVKARLDNLLAYLREAQPDVLCLQEIKSEDGPFPRAEIEELGYNVETHGQKGFNGVAILSRLPFDEVNRGLPLLNESDDDDEQARFIEGVFSGDGRVLRVASIYLPNGNPVTEDDGSLAAKFTYKLAWMDRLHLWAKGRLELEEPLVICGDYNVIPEPKDCWDPARWEGDALFRPESRDRFERLKNLGFIEAVRSCSDAGGVYTFWDYQRGARPKDHGIRIDHHLLSPEAAPFFAACGIDDHVRDWEKPSDHVPVWIELEG